MKSDRRAFLSCVVLSVLALLPSVTTAQDRTLRENPELADFFEAEVTKLEQQNELTQFETLDDWEKVRGQYRAELFDMLGLNPVPARTELNAVVTGTVEHPEFIVEKVQFQSMPGLYVTGNFYRPKVVQEKLPTILYVCGHGQVKKDGVSFGNKTHYHYHGSWFARNGYTCLTIDTLQLGEIEGIHHGTYRENRWWWNSRGYTPAGVEAWNCIRALDYLETRPEVDATRMGVTGRSGGGAYSWWISALDDRIQCSVPVAGITSLRDHVVNGCVEGHCDCMFMVNTYRWDYAKVAALVAPRPLLISNTDKDTIFPLEGVVDIHRQVRHIYRLYKADDKLGLQITEGPHEDTQELHIHAFRWFNRFFRNDKSMITKTAEKFFQPEQLRVFALNPADEVNTRIDESFVPAAAGLSKDQVLSQQDALSGRTPESLLERCFRGWPAAEELSFDTRIEAVKETANVTRITFESQPHVMLRIDIRHPDSKSLKEIRTLELLVETTGPGSDVQTLDGTDAVAVVATRPGAFGPWIGDEKKQIQIARRFQLLGMTIDGMRVWDIRRTIQTIRQECPQLESLKIRAQSGAEGVVMLASLFEEPVQELTLPVVVMDRDHPTILNLSRTIPLELIPILAAQRTSIITGSSRTEAEFLSSIVNDASWAGQRVTFAEK
ncbi:MAG: acetylxylan esterase [Planctomycetaceae bacterium]